MKKNDPRIDLDEVARRYANGRYVEQTLPGQVDTSDVSAYIAKRKEQKRQVTKVRQ